MTREYITLDHPLWDFCAGSLLPPSNSGARFSLSIFIDASGRASKIDSRNWGALAVVESSGGLKYVERLVNSVKRRHPDVPFTKHGEIKGHYLPDTTHGELWGEIHNSSKMQAVMLQMRPVDDAYPGYKKLGDLLCEASLKFSPFQPMAKTWKELNSLNHHKIQGIITPILALVERPENNAVWSKLDDISLCSDSENFSLDHIAPIATLVKTMVFVALQRHGFNMPLMDLLNERHDEGRVRVDIAAQSHDHAGIQLIDWLLWRPQNIPNKA